MSQVAVIAGSEEDNFVFQSVAKDTFKDKAKF